MYEKGKNENLPAFVHKGCVPISFSIKFTDRYSWRKKEMKCEKNKDTGSEIALDARCISVCILLRNKSTNENETERLLFKLQSLPINSRKHT